MAEQMAEQIANKEQSRKQRQKGANSIASIEEGSASSGASASASSSSGDCKSIVNSIASIEGGSANASSKNGKNAKKKKTLFLGIGFYLSTINAILEAFKLTQFEGGTPKTEFHITLAYPTKDNNLFQEMESTFKEGERVKVNIIGLYADKNAVALLCSLDDGVCLCSGASASASASAASANSASASANNCKCKHLHITCILRAGVSPVYSNELIKNTIPIHDWSTSPITIYGITYKNFEKDQLCEPSHDQKMEKEMFREWFNTQ